MSRPERVRFDRANRGERPFGNEALLDIDNHFARDVQ
jgi:hypothetical protein